MHIPATRARVALRVLMFFVGCAVVLAATAPLAPTSGGMLPSLFIGIISSLGAFALTSVFVRWDGIRLEDVGALPGRQSLLRFAFGFGIGLLLVGLHSSIELIVGRVRWVRGPTIGFGAATITFLAYLALSCREELAFHGYPLRHLEPRFGLWSAQLIVAVVFVAEHVVGGWPWGRALAGAGVGSLLFGMASIATRGLAVPIGVHAAWNVGDWMRGAKDSIGFWRPLVDHGFEGRARLVGQFGYILVMLTATAGFWWWYHRPSTQV